MSDPFVHLHVASGYSLRYGASHPHVLVERAAEHGMDALALTDRDGVYGAVKFVKACQEFGIRPLLGVDLAVQQESREPVYRRTPVRGGALIDDDHPRVTLLAVGRAGWATVCRTITATHLSGTRGAPIATPRLLAEQFERGGDVVVLLGPWSDVGRALARRRFDVAKVRLAQWQSIVPAGDLVIEVVHHRGHDDGALAARLLELADATGLPAVLTNAVRYADRIDAPVADVLDAARRLVPLATKHVDRTTAEGYLKTGKEMTEVAAEVAAAAGRGSDRAQRLLAATRKLADRCVLDPRQDLGIGVVHFPDLAVPAGQSASAVLRARCEKGFAWRGMRRTPEAARRLDDELTVIEKLGYPAYFLAVADIVDLIREMGVRCAARGSGAGSFVNYLLGISGVDPLAHGLLMERFLSPLRGALPDIDVDVESARRTEIYEEILKRYGGSRCTCVSMMDTYRVRHAIRDVGGALGLSPGEVDAIAKAFPHISARHARRALRELPELRASGFADGRHDVLFEIVERLDGLPRHIALHPCGVLLSDETLLDRTPVESSWLGFPMSQFDKDDVEDLGLLKLDVLGVRMQSAMAHALDEIRRVDNINVDIDAVPLDDPATYELIGSTRTLGCFQIESPGQRELIGKFQPSEFADLIIDISLFRPGPVKSDMVRPFLEARHGWSRPDYLHPNLRPILEQTGGVVVFHEQVLEIVAAMTGCTLAEADEVRRALSDPHGIEEARVWFRPTACAHGYPIDVVERIWQVLASFASFGFCKAHAAAFALPTYQSAWLKAHHPAAFLAGVLTHDPGMYPKRLILDDARQFGIAVLPLDVNRSDAVYRVEQMGVYDEPPPAILDAPPRPAPGYGIRLSLADVKGINDGEVERILAGRPYSSLADFWHRAGVSRPIVERLVIAGAFDELYGISATAPVRRRGRVTRRDLLLQIAELDAWSRSTRKVAQHSLRRKGQFATETVHDVAQLSRLQGNGAQPRGPASVQLALDLGDEPTTARSSGLPEMTDVERVRAELDVLGLDASKHVLDFYTPFLDALGVTRARELMSCRSNSTLLVAGVKVATQTPPIRSGRRVIFVTLDDATGPVDAALFEDAQDAYAMTLFHSWLLVIRGTLRRTGPRGLSINATGCWDLAALTATWRSGGLAAVYAAMDLPQEISEASVAGMAASRSTRPVVVRAPIGSPYSNSPYGSGPPRRLWHASPGSAGG